MPARRCWNAKNTYGCPDLVVNNAGFAWYGYFAEMDWHTADEMMGVNNAAAVHLTLAFLPGMLRVGRTGDQHQFSEQDIPSQGVALLSQQAFLNAFSTALWRELQGAGEGEHAAAGAGENAVLQGIQRSPTGWRYRSNGWVPVDAVTNALVTGERLRRVAYVPFSWR